MIFFIYTTPGKSCSEGSWNEKWTNARCKFNSMMAGLAWTQKALMQWLLILIQKTGNYMVENMVLQTKKIDTGENSFKDLLETTSAWGSLMWHILPLIT